MNTVAVATNPAIAGFVPATVFKVLVRVLQSVCFLEHLAKK